MRWIGQEIAALALIAGVLALPRLCGGNVLLLGFASAAYLAAVAGVMVVYIRWRARNPEL